MTQRQYQNAKETPRRNDKSERFAFRCTPAEKKKLMRRGGATWLRGLVRGA